MRLIFEKVILHNFLSYGHSEIDLLNKGYCLVSGVNNDARDNSLSNGSGKSTWSSAICWALTGETIQGKRNNLKNIWIDEDSCYVALEFSQDDKKFVITRYKEPKSDLKISVNGEDKSGKTFKESEQILAQYVPDLTSELIASIIILGQGLPNKFTANTPSGRKEVLEKLSKSDFMIQDIKNRLAKVISDNNGNLRKIDDALLTISTKKDMLNTQLGTLNNTLLDLNKPRNFNEEIESLTNILNELKTNVQSHLARINEGEAEIKVLNENLNTILTHKQEDLNKENTEFDEFKSEYYNRKSTLQNDYITSKNSLTTELNNTNNKLTTEFNKLNLEYSTEINSLKAEITKLDSITDICPTCGQKIPGAVKPNTSAKKEEVKELTNNLNSFIKKYNEDVVNAKAVYDSQVGILTNNYSDNVKKLDDAYTRNNLEHNNYLKKIEADYANDITEINKKLREKHQSVDLYSSDMKLKNGQIVTKETELNKVKMEFENHTKQLKDTTDSINTVTETLKKLDEETLYNNNERNQISDRLNIDKKIETLIKRDFRGFLLSNVINFINAKAKEYAVDIFGNNEVEFTLDGNNIEISYLGKSFENLSGGEKQKIDLIIQFAIRDMMSQYLDFSCNIFILDEIFDNLDVIGCNNVLNLISRRLNDIESMFIISHHADTLEIPYDCEMVIIKDQNGISKVK